MKLAEALKERKRLINELNALEERLLEGLVYYPQEVEKSFTPSGIYTKAEFDAMMQKWLETHLALAKLKAAICEANNEALEEDGTSIQVLVIQRGEYQSEVKFFKQMRAECVNQNSRRFGYMHEKEAQRKTLLPATALDAEIDARMAQIAELDAKLAELNHKIEVRLD
jgi:hypothetical protein